MRKKRIDIRYIGIIVVCSLLAACSMTKNIPEDDQLFTGLKRIVYADNQKDSFEAHRAVTMEEIEAALATEPNGSLFGSSYFSMPWSWHLWVYNHYAKKNSHFARWMTKSFGKPPVLMSQVNPALRASVARSVLKNNGFFRGNVTYETITSRNPKKAKIAYTVTMDSLYTLDSVAYLGFPADMRQLIDSTASEQYIKPGSPFSVSALDNERSRLGILLRNNGYYYYNPSYASYLADTFAIANQAQLRLQLADGVPDEALRKWSIGKVDVQFRRSFRERLTDSIQRRQLTIHYNGKRSPIVPRVVLRNLRLRSRQPYSYEKYMESVSNINATGVFSSVDFQFTPRPDADSLDLLLNCVFDKPYDFYFEANAIGRTSGRYGPEARIGFTRRNAFRGAEKLDLNLHGAYEWQSGGGDDMNSYQYGFDASLEFPRIIAPFYNSDRVRRGKDGRPRRRLFFSTPMSYAKVSTDIVRRPQYYKMHIVAGEWTYRWQSAATMRHEFSPLSLKYQYMNSHTERFDSVIGMNPYLLATMEDYFVPKMRYSFTYTSPASKRNPLRWETTIEEAGNILSLFDRLNGHSFNEKEKQLFKTPYSQFLRLETDLTKTWTIGLHSQLVGHFNGGIIYSYGNSEEPPFSETFYAGGANSIRSFGVRRIGPGAFNGSKLDRQSAFLMQNGDIKLVANLEYRTRLFGNLNGAIFLDAGNVWNLKQVLIDTDEDDDDEVLFLSAVFNQLFANTQFKPSKLLNQAALGTGVGLRYDLGFLVIRIDWGLALHSPYDTSSKGYFNVRRFRDAQTLHFAIGYPF
ncbi:MAG: BamA/TamA family outer membrane protein [Prevotella sp.]|nr:BamA/TamA family outer membrane protein [Prevotella sp.]